MKKIKIDARGLECPQPVVLTKKALEEMSVGDTATISVDNEVAKENVIRMATHEGCDITINESGNDSYEIKIKYHLEKGERSGKQATDCVVYMFDSDFIGTNRELGKVLCNAFLKTVLELPHKNVCIVLLSNGVRLAIKGSYVLETLKTLSARGVKILICGTCLDFLKIKNKLMAGTISNALEIMECLTSADKLIKF